MNRGDHSKICRDLLVFTPFEKRQQQFTLYAFPISRFSRNSNSQFLGLCAASSFFPYFIFCCSSFLSFSWLLIHIFLFAITIFTICRVSAAENISFANSLRLLRGFHRSKFVRKFNFNTTRLSCSEQVFLFFFLSSSTSSSSICMMHNFCRYSEYVPMLCLHSGNVFLTC